MAPNLEPPQAGTKREMHTEHWGCTPPSSDDSRCYKAKSFLWEVAS